MGNDSEPVRAVRARRVDTFRHRDIRKSRSLVDFLRSEAIHLQNYVSKTDSLGCINNMHGCSFAGLEAAQFKVKVIDLRSKALKK
jgi:hypothetical protein